MTPTAFTVDDLFLHHRVHEIQASATGRLACTVRSVDRERDAFVSCIWGFAPDGSWERQLTRGPGEDEGPRWSPDGRQLAFLSDRGGSAQVHVMPADGGEARALSRLEGAVSALRWAPDGRSLVVAASMRVDPDARGKRPRGAPPERNDQSPEVAWKLPYKSDGVGYLLAREIHLFRIDSRSGTSQQLTDGPFDVLGFDPSPNGRHLAFVRTREGRFAHRSDLWVCDADGQRARCLTRRLAMVAHPVWSPDGRWIACSGSEEEGDAQARLWLVDFTSGALRRLGTDDLLVADPESVHWEHDSRHVRMVRAWRGRHQVIRLDTETGGFDVLVAGDRQLGAVASCGESIVYAVEHPAMPSELWACRPDGAGERQLSDFNPWWRERTPILAETWQFEAPDGRGGTEMIEGWLLRGEGSASPLPLLNDVHGGPAAYALLDYDSNVYWQVLCSQGWAVLALNAVGSASYGTDFCDRLVGHWGEYDLPQHLAAVDQLTREGICDDRLAIAGKSYGGYLAAWAIGHVHRFRAAIVMAPVGNIETHYGTSDGGYYADPYYMGSGAVFDRRLASALSPLRHIEKATTPTLFLQGKEDERCPKCQGEELFVSLMRAGETPAELVLYPQQGHRFLGEGPPSVRADAARRIIDWLDAHRGAPATTGAATDEQTALPES